jgi:hypothetical protein
MSSLIAGTQYHFPTLKNFNPGRSGIAQAVTTALKFQN